MATLSHSRLIRAVAMGAVVLLGFGTLALEPVSGQVQENQIVSDSEIELLEQAESGAYQRYRIRISTRDGGVVLETDKDGSTAAFQVTFSVSLQASGNPTALE